MITPNQGSSLFQDSSLNMTPRENCYSSGYKGPNEILQDDPNREWNLFLVVKVSDPNDETRTNGNSYKFVMMNSPERSHLGKNFISPSW